MRISHNNHGFTLIELSIVLVIIGLISAGVLIGRDLIRAAEIRAAVTQLQNIELALSTFKLKYNCIPGDCRTARALGLVDYPDPLIGNGNGNGVIDYTNLDGSLPIPSNIRESEFVFMHIHLAKMLNYPFLAPVPTGSIKTKIGRGAIRVEFYYAGGGGVGGYNLTGRAYLVTQGTELVVVPGVGAWNAPLYSPFFAYGMDSKIDNGMPYTGVYTSSGPEPGPGTVNNGQLPLAPSDGPIGSAKCVNSDVIPKVYNVTNATNLCVAQYQFM
jgi:prepilin-type N-terminal cleavage/methylation domain-containing protein